MGAPRKYAEELRERAVRLAVEARRDPNTKGGALRRIGAQLGINPETLRNWVQQAEIDAGDRPGVTSDDAARIAESEREVRELRRANQILKSASAFFAAELDRPADGRQVDVDFAYDWRGAEPARLQVGPVLSVDDAVASKTNAVYTRLEALDLDAIRSSGRYTDDELLRLVADRDDGFDRAMFAQQLQQVDRIRDDRFAAYGLDSDAAAALRRRTTRWAAELAGGEPSASTSRPAATRRTTLAAIRGHREP